MDLRGSRDTRNGKVLSVSEELLASEIRFWRELIEAMDGSTESRESAERMRQALALAEYRLAHLDESPVAGGNGKPSNPASH